MATNPSLSTNVGVSQIFLNQIQSAPPISTSNVSGFQAVPNLQTGGVDITFALTDVTGVASVTLLRASTPDVAQATVLQTWTASVATFTWSDTDVALQSMAQAYYWLTLEPVNATGTATNAGPQFILLNPSAATPAVISSISASHDNSANGNVQVTVNVSGLPSGATLKVYASGYQGVSSYVGVASSALSQTQFTLKATSETITLEAIAVSVSGVEAASGPTCTLTLNGSRTVPCSPESCQVSAIGADNTLQFPANLESYVTGYQVYRGATGTTFSSATEIGTVTAGASTLTYTDTGAASGPYQYYLIAVASVGNSTEGGPFITSGQVYSGSGPLLLNPNYVAGNTGWGTGTGVSIVAGAGYLGSGYLGQIEQVGTVAMFNQQEIPCAEGTVLSASCFVQGGSAATGDAVLRVGFFNSSGTEILETGYPTGATANIGWQPQRLSATAPANTAYAKVNFAVFSQTAGIWQLGGFTASILPSSLADVPNSPGTNQYAAVELGADKTLNHVLTATLTLEDTISVTGSGSATIFSFGVTANDSSDVFNLTAILNIGYGSSVVGAASALGYVDGSGTFGVGYAYYNDANLSPTLTFIGSATGMTAGAHTITLVFKNSSSSSVNVNEFTTYALLQQISS